MRVKSIVTMVLLLFVGISLVLVIVKGTRQSTSVQGEIESSAPDNAVVVYYFHFTRRCPTCTKIEELAHRAVTERFADQLREKELVWVSLNVEQPEYEHFAEDYQLVSQSLVLVDNREGRGKIWKNLDQIWELVWEEESFLNYVQAEIQQFMKTS